MIHIFEKWQHIINELKHQRRRCGQSFKVWGATLFRIVFTGVCININLQIIQRPYQAEHGVASCISRAPSLTTPYIERAL